MLYFDHAASTDTFPEITDGIVAKIKLFGNPSSVHQAGQLARQVIDEARYSAANVFGTGLGNVIFTSGATEALHMAVVGYYLAQKMKGDFVILMSPLMHSAAIESVEFLVKNFGVKVKNLPIDSHGFIDLKKIEEKDLKKVDMVLCEHGNSEIGLIQPVPKLGKLIRRVSVKDRPVFIVDAAASIVDTHVSLDFLVCDALMISGEKFGGLKGAGLLLRRDEFLIDPLVGGSQEFGYRGGTENLLGIWAIGKALKLHNEKRDVLRDKWEGYQELLRNFFVQKFKGISVTTPERKYLPHIFHFRLSTGVANIFVQQCDLLGLCVSAGSACSSGNVMGSKVLLSLGIDDLSVQRGIRISFGRDTSRDEVHSMLEILKKILKKGDF